MARPDQRPRLRLPGTVFAAAWVLSAVAPAHADAPLGLGPKAPDEAAAVLPVLDAAEGAVDDDGQEPRVRAELVAEAETLAPGAATRLGVRLTMDPGWHVYWRHPGGGAAPTVIAFDDPTDAARFTPVRWPAPARFSEANDLIVTFGYAGEVLLWTEVTVDDGATEATASAQIDLLACASECIPASFTLSAPLPVVAGDVPGAGAAFFDHYEALVPDSPGDAGLDVTVHLGQTAIRPGDGFRAVLEVVRCAGPPAPGEHCEPLPVPEGGVPLSFIPDRIRGVQLEPVGVRPHPNAFAGAVVDLAGRAGPDDPRADQRLSGVLRLGGQAPVTLLVDGNLPRVPAGTEIAAVEDSLFATPPAVEASVTAATPVSGPTPPGIALVLLFAFVGGLILNLMPCVLPVLAIKAFAFTRLAHEGRGRVAAHAAAYTAGIVGTLMALAAAVVALRAAGTELGWGFQLQEPLFVALVAAVLVVFALNLFGVFELSLGDGGLGARVDDTAGLSRSAAEGVLAVVLATPCSAPFLGTAVGFAFASGPGITFAVFFALGLGLAAPFALLVLVPGARRIVPRPGPWMDGVRRALGFALLATVVWLAWVLGRVTGADGIVALLAFLLTVALATWIVAGGGRGAVTRAVRWGVAGALVSVVGAGTLRFPVAPRTPPGGPTEDAAGLVWADFEPAAVRDAVSAGHVVLVDFTADWCITCKVNERVVLADDAVRAALGTGDVALFKADWTQRDETIRAELARHGKAGVPLYLVYSPARPTDPEVLPEILTVDRVLEALTSARDGRTAASVDDRPVSPHTPPDGADPEDAASTAPAAPGDPA